MATVQNGSREPSLVGRLESFLKQIPALRGTRTRVRAELSALVHTIRSGVWRQVFRGRRERNSRRRQLPLVWQSSLSLDSSQPDLAGELRRLGIQYHEGSHALYIPPQAGLAATLGAFVDAYPPEAGYKLLKNPKGPDDAHYIGDLRRHPWVRSALVGTAADLIPVANFLHDQQIAPRLYDVAQLSAGASQLTMFVVQHIAGTCPTKEECATFLSRLRQLSESNQLITSLADWEHHDDFLSPDCNGNLLKSSMDGQLYYVDFQNFLIPEYDTYLHKVLDNARNTVHFGREYLFRGGRYLYQQIPGVASSGKRDIRLRWEQIKALLAQQDVGVRGRVVLDVGCNTGMVLAETLNDGAQWGIGWDLPEVVAHGSKILSALGYTRYHLTGARLAKNYPLMADIPSHLHPQLGNSILLYLAIRHHIGLIDALASVPWQVLVYEGPQEETPDELREVIHQLEEMASCEVAATGEIEDGDCTKRPLVVFRRRSQRP